MYAKITKDLLVDGEIITTDRTGQVLWNGPLVGNLLQVRLLDDDREVYYEAVADDEVLESLASWAAKDSGVTILQTKQHGAWKDAIS